MRNLAGMRIVDVNDREYVLDQELGRGSQGVIYTEKTGKYLIKLFLGKRNLESSLGKIKKLMRLKFPPRFIRPIDIVEVRGKDGGLALAGYIMEKVVKHISLNKFLIPPQGENFSQWYNDFSGGLKRRLYISYLIAMNFYLLHRDNIAYCDISGNNILVSEDPRKCSVCMIDIDNLYSPGYEKATVLGTPRYMAPEIGKGQMQPDILSDDYSLAVIVFELLKCGHPYIGDYVEQSSPEIEELAFLGGMPYIEDPDNDINRSSSVLPNDVVFSEKLSKLFEKNFVDGKTNRMSRSTSLDIALKCLEASNSLIKCEHCGAWFFPNNKVGESEYQCPWCDGTNRLSAYFLVHKRYPSYLSNSNGKEQYITARNVKSIAKKTYILGHSELNKIPENYFHDTISDAEIAEKSDKSRSDIAGNIRTALQVVYDSGVWKAKNVSGRIFYYRKENQGEFLPFEPMTKIELSNGDCIYDDKEKQKDKLTYNEIVNGDIGSKTFLKFYQR